MGTDRCNDDRFRARAISLVDLRGNTVAKLEWRLGELAETSSGADEFSISVRPEMTEDDLREALESGTTPAG